MIEWCSGDILDSEARTLLCPVNCRPGVMGAGLAFQFQRRWRCLIRMHAECCRAPMRERLRPGRVALVSPEESSDVIVAFLATKDHYRDPSRMEWVRDGLECLGEYIRNSRIIDQAGSYAVPKLGCGLGGLAWSDVRPIVVELAGRFPHAKFLIFGEPPPSLNPTRTTGRVAPPRAG